MMLDGLSHGNYVIGIGASAGGLEALKLFLDHMDPDTGMSFIIVQHLSPDYKSILAELLSVHTGMKVMEAEHRKPLLPNCVYVIPPGKDLTVGISIEDPRAFGLE